MSPIAITNNTLSGPVEPFHQSTAKLSKNPLERTWRGNREGTLSIDGYPSFMYAQDDEGLMKKREWVKQHLAVCFRFWGKLGYGEGISGHITVRVRHSCRPQLRIDCRRGAVQLMGRILF